MSGTAILRRLGTFQQQTKRPDIILHLLLHLADDVITARDATERSETRGQLLFVLFPECLDAEWRGGVPTSVQSANQFTGNPSQFVA